MRPFLILPSRLPEKLRTLYPSPQSTAILQSMVAICGLVCSLLTLCPGAAAETSPDQPAVILENEALRWEWAADGRTLHFIEKANWADHLDTVTPGQRPRVHIGDKVYPAASCVQEGGLIQIAFEECGCQATLKVDIKPRRLTLEVVDVNVKDVKAFTFIDVFLKSDARREETFAVCALAMNLQTQVYDLPGPMNHLEAICSSRFGLVGSKAGILAAPMNSLRGEIKEAVLAEEGLVHSTHGGAWAMDSESARGSYLIDFTGKLSEENVDRWIELAKHLGIKQIDFHTGHSLRFGDYVPNPEVFPSGVAGIKAVTDKLHAAGMLAGLHTYAFFVSKESCWVSPVPDKRLARDRVFTLAEDLDMEDQSITVLESTVGMSAVTGFQIRNSATLQIDEELITYKAVETGQPGKFLECVRGACGTRISKHAKSAQVAHLKECFDLFVPDGDSTLFEEVAEKTASLYNEAGFDMLYLDALDAADVFSGGLDAWHYGSKFVFELCQRIHRPALMEMSTMGHHLWHARSRMGAWDCPSRAAKRFIDMHALANQAGARNFMPTNLGWWGVFNWQGVAPERTMPDDIEYLCAKALAADSGLSLLVGFTPDIYASSAYIRKLSEIIRQYDDLRMNRKVPAEILKELAVPGKDFNLAMSGDGAALFCPVEYASRTVEIKAGETASWSFKNPHHEQPLRLRIEALLSPEEYNSPGSKPLLEFASEKTLDATRSVEGVHGSMRLSDETSPSGERAVCMTAVNQLELRDGAWLVYEKTFEPLYNLKQRGLGLWIKGDGKGAVLDLQLRSPARLGGGKANHYVDVDWTGWRRLNLIEPKEEQIGRFDWPFAKSASKWRANPDSLSVDAYPNLHAWVTYDTVESIGIWCNNLPSGEATTFSFSPVRAVPLSNITLINMAIEVNGAKLTLPLELKTGCWLEFKDARACEVYNDTGEPIDTITLESDAPLAVNGENRISFSGVTAEGLPARARVTTILTGEPLTAGAN